METCIGHVTHYYSHLGVAVVRLSDGLKINHFIHFLGFTTDFIQKVWSMEVDHHQIDAAGPGAEVAIKVCDPVREGDRAFLVTEEIIEVDEVLGF